MAADGRPVSQFRVRFLHVSELSPRKNQAGLLRAWLQATTPADDAILILKLGLYSAGWDAEWEAAVQRLQQETGKRLAEAAPILTLHAILPDAEMPGLYAAASHYISLSNGEGWDQPMVEAAAAGLRLIAPDHSAYRAYLDRTTATLLPVREAPADFPGGGTTGLLFRGSSWWTPDLTAAVAAIRAAIEGRDAPHHSARERVLREFTWERATTRLIRLLAAAEQAGSRAGGAMRWPGGWLRPRRGRPG